MTLTAEDLSPVRNVDAAMRALTRDAIPAHLAVLVAGVELMWTAQGLPHTREEAVVAALEIITVDDQTIDEWRALLEPRPSALSLITGGRQD